MSNQIETLELTKEQAQHAIKLREHAKKLLKNRDFKAVFEDEYFDAYIKNTALLLSEVKQDSPKMYEDLVDELEAVGRVRAFIQGIFQKANMAEKSIEDADAQLAELRAEGVDE